MESRKRVYQHSREEKEIPSMMKNRYTILTMQLAMIRLSGKHGAGKEVFKKGWMTEEVFHTRRSKIISYTEYV